MIFGSLKFFFCICLAQPNHSGNFGKGRYKEYLGEIILNLSKQFRPRNYKAFSMLNSAEH